MPNSVDERVVSMKFDNKQFESGAQSSLSILDKLKTALKLEGATKGLQDVDKAAKNLNLANLSSSVEQISSKLSSMGIIGVTALMNITNAAMNAGVQLAKSLSTDQIAAGFSEYELKMGSIQTILANTAQYGTTLDQVTASLDQLNTYADKTIYNFGDMTRNIGLFTNAGIKLEDATAMIKGFSNEAAASGTNSAAAAGAAYQLSQALSAGQIRLMDWRSLTNAGMGGANMKKGLIDLASAMGTFNSKTTTSEKAAKDFNGSLEKGWLTADVMQNYLKIQAGELSAEQMKAIGLTSKQIEAFQKQAKTAEDAATKVRTFTQLIGTIKESVGSSWAQTFDILFGNFNEATDLFTNINNSLGSMIAASGDARNAVLQGWKDLGGRTELITALSNVFDALLSVMKPIGEAFGEIFPPVTAQTLYNMTVALKEFTAGLKLGSTDAENLKRTFKGLFALLDIGWQTIKGVAGAFGLVFKNMSPAGSGILEFTAQIGDFIVKVDEALKSGQSLGSLFGGVGEFFDKGIAGIKAFLEQFRAAISDFMSMDTTGIDSLLDRIKARLTSFSGIGKIVQDAFKGITDAISTAFPGVINMANTIGKAFKAAFDKIKEAIKNASFNDVMDVANTGIFAALLLGITKFIKGLNSAIKSGGPLGSLKDILDGVTGSLKAMQADLQAKTLLKIAGAIAILAAALLVLSLIDSNKMASSLAAVTTLFVELTASMAVFSKFSNLKSSVSMTAMAAGLILFSVAILILSAAVKNLAGLSWEEIAKGLTAVTLLIGALTISAKSMDKDTGPMIKSAVALVIFALAIKVLVSAVKSLSGMDTVALAKGLIGVGVLLTELALFMKVTDLDGMGVSKGIGILIMAAAIKVLASAVQDFAASSWQDLSKGLVSIGILLAEISLFANTTGNTKNLVSTAVGMVIIGAALKIFASAVKDFANMSWEELGKGLMSMAVALGLVVIAMNLLPSDMLQSAVGLLIVSAALLIIAQVVKSFGGMSWEEIAKGLVTLAGSLLIIAGAMKLMTGALPGAAALIVVALALGILAPILKTFGKMKLEEIGAALLMLAGVFVVLGLAGLVLSPIVPTLLLLGAAIALIGIGALAAGVGLLAFSAGFTALAAAGAAGVAVLTLAITAVLSLIPFAMQQIGLGILAFAQVIADGGPALTAAFTTVLLSIIDTINTCAPQIVDCLINLVWLMVNALVDNVPKLVDAGFQLLIGVLDGIANNIGKVVDSATDVIVNFLDGLSKNMDRIIQAGADLIVSFLEGIANGIRNNSDRFNQAGLDIASAIVDGMVSGIGNGVQSVINAATSMANSAFHAAMSALEAHSPSKKFVRLGGWVDAGLVKGINDDAGDVEKAGSRLGAAALAGAVAAVAAISDSIDSNLEVSPKITPVVDLSNIKSSGSAISKMFTGQAGLDISSNYTQAQRTAALQNSVGSTSGDISANGGTTISYTQNNYSPKALSRLEIYRQTQNQIATIKGAMV